MPFTRESVEYFSRRNKQLDNLKANTKIGIFGSFYKTRKSDLLSLKKFLTDCGYFARISEDLDTRKAPHKQDSAYSRELSIRLVMESDIHLFILPYQKNTDSKHLIQSVSMEIERLVTLEECREKSARYCAIYLEKGLRGTMGSVFEGLIDLKKDDWVIDDFESIEDIFKSARQFCLNCIMDMYSF
jgi:hypothetical protein